VATKVEFSNEEWEVLRDAPHSVAIAVAVAGASGIFGSLKEAMASAGAIVEALKGDNALLRDICSREEMKAAQKSLRNGMEVTDIDSLRKQLKNSATDRVAAAVTLLNQKGFTEDLEAYKSFMEEIGNRVALAAKEGGFLGFGGERVSEGEREVLAKLGDALDVQQV
jgi:hypothetical protein